MNKSNTVNYFTIIKNCMSRAVEGEIVIDRTKLKTKLQRLDKITSFLDSHISSLLNKSQLTSIREALKCAQLSLIITPHKYQIYSLLQLISESLGYLRQSEVATTITQSGLHAYLSETVNEILNKINDDTANISSNLFNKINLSESICKSILTELAIDDFESEKYLQSLVRSRTLSQNDIDWSVLSSEFKIAGSTYDVYSELTEQQTLYATSQIIEWISSTDSIIWKAKQSPWLFSYDRNTLPDHVLETADEQSRQSRLDVILVKETNVTVYAHTNVPHSKNADQVYFPISRESKIFLSRHSDIEPLYMYSYNLFEEDPDELGLYRLNLKKYYLNRLSTGTAPVFLLGSSNNFGHFLMDHVARLSALLQNQASIKDLDVDKVPLLCPRLTPWQRDILQLMQIKNPIMETPQSKGELYEITCPSLIVSGTISIPTKFAFLRQRVSDTLTNVRVSSKTIVEKVYLSRSKWDSTRGHRIYEAERIDTLFQSLGFKLLFPEDYSFLALAEILFKSSIIATDASSSAFNYFFLSGRDTIHLCMIPRASLELDLGIQKGFTWHLPFWDRTIFVKGEPIDKDLPIEVATIRYQDESIKAGVRDAEQLCFYRHPTVY